MKKIKACKYFFNVFVFVILALLSNILIVTCAQTPVLKDDSSIKKYKRNLAIENAENMDIFLLLGQSNMEGPPAPEDQDKVENPNILVLGYNNYSYLDRTYNEWSVASPPLHSDWAGVGPGDYFAKTLAQARTDAVIGLVPCAISGAEIDLFRKDVISDRRGEWTIPPDNHWEGGYDWILERARKAQEYGTIRGIIFHQGESDTGQIIWVDKVAELVSDLRTDLGLGTDVPFIAGEVLYAEYGGACAAHNPIVQMIPDAVPNSYVVSAAGLNGMDQYHFNLESQRELGVRYAEIMMQAISWQNGSSSSSISSSSSSSSSVSSISSSSSSSSTSSSSSQSDEGVTASYVISDDWGTGFVCSVTINNNNNTVLNSWTLEWTYSGNQTITNAWNVDLVQNGNDVTAENPAYTSVPANGSYTFGFQATYSGSNEVPVITINGQQQSSSSSSSSSSSTSSSVSSSSSSSSSVSSSSSSSSSSMGTYVTITAPFTKDGSGEFFYKTDNIPNYINSWNLQLLDINGVDLTNVYKGASSLPAKQDGFYYIHYISQYSWGHFEVK